MFIFIIDLNMFLHELNFKKELWWRLANRYRYDRFDSTHKEFVFEFKNQQRNNIKEWFMSRSFDQNTDQYDDF